VAVPARCPFARVRPRINGEPGVIERCAGPRGCVVTRLASGGERRCYVIGVGYRLVFGLVARVAIGRRARVPSADMTTRAGHLGMRSREREDCLAVVEDRWDPRRGVMANLTIRREAAGRVIGIRGLLEVSQVARDAGRGESGVNSARMTTVARESDVRSRQRKRCLRVIKRGPQPVRCAVADRAVRWETCRHMVWVGSALKVLVVARVTRSGCAGEGTAGVALRTGQAHVSAGEREFGLGVVIERGRQPCGSGVALLAGLGKASGHVVGIRGLLEVPYVAGGTLRGRPSEPATGMTLCARHRDVRSGERKRSLRVIKVRTAPGCGVVTGLASLRDPGSHMVGASGLLEVRQVAAGALGGRPSEPAAGVALRAC
jgi:hypothetical protein